MRLSVLKAVAFTTKTSRLQRCCRLHQTGSLSAEIGRGVPVRPQPDVVRSAIRSQAVTSYRSLGFYGRAPVGCSSSSHDHSEGLLQVSAISEWLSNQKDWNFRKLLLLFWKNKKLQGSFLDSLVSAHQGSVQVPGLLLVLLKVYTNKNDFTFII